VNLDSTINQKFEAAKFLFASFFIHPNDDAKKSGALKPFRKSSHQSYPGLHHNMHNRFGTGARQSLSEKVPNNRIQDCIMICNTGSGHSQATQQQK